MNWGEQGSLRRNGNNIRTDERAIATATGTSNPLVAGSNLARPTTNEYEYKPTNLRSWAFCFLVAIRGPLTRQQRPGFKHSFAGAGSINASQAAAAEARLGILRFADAPNMNATLSLQGRDHQLDNATKLYVLSGG